MTVLRREEGVVCDPSVMLRASAARAVHPRVFGPGGDVDFYLRLSSQGAIGNLPEVLHLMRLHESSMSFRRIADQLCGIAYAVAADQPRRRGEQEPDSAVFQRDWQG